MRQYLAPFFIYLFIGFLFPDQPIAYAAKIIIVGSLLFYYRKEYNLKFNLGFIPFLAGVLIFLIWIFVDITFKKPEFIPPSPLYLAFKLIGFIFIASFIEELFVRDFFIRVLISNNWKKVKVGAYTHLSFIFTALFFGFSHHRWVAALLTGVILNLLLYKEKNIGSCIIAHSTANLLLSIYILATGSFALW